MPVWPKSKHIADLSAAVADLREWFDDDRAMPEPDSVRQVLAEIERLEAENARLRGAVADAIGFCGHAPLHPEVKSLNVRLRAALNPQPERASE